MKPRLTFRKKPFEYREQGWDLNFGSHKQVAIVAPYGNSGWYWYGGLEPHVEAHNTLWRTTGKTFKSEEEAKQDCLAYFKSRLDGVNVD